MSRWRREVSQNNPLTTKRREGNKISNIYWRRIKRIWRSIERSLAIKELSICPECHHTWLLTMLGNCCKGMMLRGFICFPKVTGLGKIGLKRGGAKGSVLEKGGFNLLIRKWPKWLRLLSMLKKWFIKKVHSTVKMYGTWNIYQSSNGIIWQRNWLMNNDWKNRDLECKWNKREKCKSTIPVRCTRAKLLVVSLRIRCKRVNKLTILKAESLGKDPQSRKKEIDFVIYVFLIKKLIYII